jgi:hypothetical protein
MLFSLFLFVVDSAWDIQHLFQGQSFTYLLSVHCPYFNSPLHFCFGYFGFVKTQIFFGLYGTIFSNRPRHIILCILNPELHSHLLFGYVLQPLRPDSMQDNVMFLFRQRLFYFYLNNCTGYFWEADSRWTTQEISRCYWNIKFHNCCHRVITKMTNTMQLCRLIYCSLTALHVSSDIFAHYQEHLNCIYSF